MHRSYKKYVLILFLWSLVACYISRQSHAEEPSTDSGHGPSPLTDPISIPGKLEQFSVYCNKLMSRLEGYWWVILLSTILPLILFYRVEGSLGKKTPSWQKPYAQSQRQNPKNRRPTLPDLTLARHARRESGQQRRRSPILHRKKSTGNNTISQMNDTRKGSFERNDDSQSDNKRVHLIRRY